jgi:hypothetical protein
MVVEDASNDGQTTRQGLSCLARYLGIYCFIRATVQLDTSPVQVKGKLPYMSDDEGLVDRLDASNWFGECDNLCISPGRSKV